MIAPIKKDVFEYYWRPLKKKEINKLILTLKNKYPNKIQRIEEINAFLLKFT